jgi:hypothetical protein
MADEPRKRSRFDQTEPTRTSRFDRRSKSPLNRRAPDRSRSPLSSRSPSNTVEKKIDAAAAAAAAAARINAQLQLKKGIQHVDVPPILNSVCKVNPLQSGPNLTFHDQPASASKPSDATAAVAGEVYTQDGDYIKDIEINDLRNRYTLTRGQTQKMVNIVFVKAPLIKLRPILFDSARSSAGGGPSPFLVLCISA